MPLKCTLGFPLFIEDNAYVSDGGDDPFSTETMAGYMESNHYHWMTEETPTKFSDFRLKGKLVFRMRDFWVWTCRDGFDRTWDITVGQGEAPVVGHEGQSKWMHASCYADVYSPRTIIIDEYPEHGDEQGSPN